MDLERYVRWLQDVRRYQASTVVVIDTAALQDEVVGFVLGASDHAGHTSELAKDRRAMRAADGFISS